MSLLKSYYKIWKRAWVRFRTCGLREAFPPPIIDMRQTELDPISAFERMRVRPLFGDRYQALINVPLLKCIGLTLNAFSFKADSMHPFVKAMRMHMYGMAQDEVVEELAKYYRNWTPETAAEVYGFDTKNAPEWSRKKREAKPLPLPWEKRRIDSYKKKSRQGFGPRSYADVKNKYVQLSRLCDSLKSQGYDRDREKKIDKKFEDIEGLVLKQNTEWRLLITKGQNRSAVAAALGYDKVSVCIRRVIDRSELYDWPGVRNGLFSPRQALFVFDRMFHMEQPKGWLDVESQEVVPGMPEDADL